jgi:peptide/nickel transport system permease protein
LTTYITRRVLGLIPLLFGISIVSYALIGLAPGGAAGVFAGLQRQMTEADRQLILHNLGLDKPWYVQYFYWLKNLLINHSLGNSYIDGRPVLVKILEKLPVTLEVIGLAFLCTLLLAIPIAIYAATHKNSIFDHLATLLAFVGYGAPVFWVAIMLLELFSVQLRWLPAGGLADIQSTHFDLWERVKHLILPVATLTFVGMASWMRYQRAAMLEVLNEDYIRTASSKGLSRRVVIFKHALRNALLPVITLIGLFLPALLTGAYFVETIYTIPGMGYLALTAVFERDYPVIMGTTMLSAVFVVLGNLFADIAYAAVDPRIRYG